MTTKAKGKPAPVTRGDDLLTPKEAAEFTGIPVRTLNAWRTTSYAAKTIVGPKFCKIATSGWIKYRRADLTAFMRNYQKERRAGPALPMVFETV